MLAQIGQNAWNDSLPSIIKVTDPRQREMFINPPDNGEGPIYINLGNRLNSLLSKNNLKFDSFSFHTIFECIERYANRGEIPTEPINVHDDNGKILQISSPYKHFLCFEIVQKNQTSGLLEPAAEDSKLFLEHHVAKDLIETLKEQMPQCAFIWSGVILDFKKFISDAQAGHTPYAGDRYELKNPHTLRVIEKRKPSPYSVQEILEASAKTGRELYPIRIPYGANTHYGLAYDMPQKELPNFSAAAVSPTLRRFAKQG